MKCFSFLMLFFLSCNGFAVGQTGNLDPTFGNQGIVVAGFTTNSSEYGWATALQSDGKILVAGTIIINNAADFIMLRLLPDGQTDSTFGTAGWVKTDYGTANSRANDMVIQPDGKIIMAGQVGIAASDCALARYLPNGALDSTFGVAGKVKTDFGNTYENFTTIAIQPDGKIVAAGITFGTSFDFCLARYLTNGALDTTFGSAGIMVTSIQDEDQMYGLGFQSDGKILLAGYSALSGVVDFVVARYHPDGILDKSFGTGGYVLTDIANSNQVDLGSGLIILPDDKIMVAGVADYQQGIDPYAKIAIVQYLPDGEKDPDFGTDGMAVHEVGTGNEIWGFDRQPGGKFFVAGRTRGSNGADTKWSLIRCNPNGSLDSLFGTNGLVTTDFPAAPSTALDILIQPDSKVVAVGLVGPFDSIDFGIARYITDFNVGTKQVAEIQLPFEISPNPGTGLFTLTLDKPGAIPLQVIVTDITGRIVYTTTMETPNQIEKSLDLRSLNPGSYQLYLEDGIRRGVKQLIIAR